MLVKVIAKLQLNNLPVSDVVEGAVVVLDTSFGWRRRRLAHKAFPKWFGQHKFTAILDQHSDSVRFTSLECGTASLLALERPPFIATFECYIQGRPDEGMITSKGHCCHLSSVAFYDGMANLPELLMASRSTFSKFLAHCSTLGDREHAVLAACLSVPLMAAKRSRKEREKTCDDNSSSTHQSQQLSISGTKIIDVKGQTGRGGSISFRCQRYFFVSILIPLSTKQKKRAEE